MRDKIIFDERRSKCVKKLWSPRVCSTFPSCIALPGAQRYLAQALNASINRNELGCLSCPFRRMNWGYEQDADWHSLWCVRQVHKTGLKGSFQVVWIWGEYYFFPACNRCRERNFSTSYSHNPRRAFYFSPEVKFFGCISDWRIKAGPWKTARIWSE